MAPAREEEGGVVGGRRREGGMGRLGAARVRVLGGRRGDLGFCSVARGW